MEKAPIFAVNRLRIATDGEGVTTLVTFGGCPLRCRYCINPQCHDPKRQYQVTTDELLKKVSIDNLYFLATGGGICFGGGEPTSYPQFIKEFRQLCPTEWRITIETSLNVPEANIDALLPSIDYWIVDIKDMSPDIYTLYTGLNNERVYRNLAKLAATPSKCLIRVPLIPNYNSTIDQDQSIKRLRSFGFDQFDRFAYKRTDR